MNRLSWSARSALLIGLTAALLYTLACGVSGTPQKTYLYVGEAFVPPTAPPVPAGFVAQFRVENDGTLTALSSSTISSVVPFFAATVTPSNQYLFVPSGATSEFGIGSNGVLAPKPSPAVTGNSVAFTPNGNFAIIVNSNNATLSSYRLDSAGALTPISTVATGGSPEDTVVDRSGKFAYVSDTNNDTVLEYSISTGGVLTPIGSVPAGGYNPRALVVSPNGFLYCGNTSSGSVTEFAINASTGTLSLVNSYSIWVQPQPGTLWMSFAPTGAYAYVGNGEEIAALTVDTSTGGLTSNGTISNPYGELWGGVDPSGRFLFSAGEAGMVSQFIISGSGTLIPNGSASLGANMVGETLAFARR